LTLARLDESGGRLTRREPIQLDELTESVVKGYGHARVPVRLAATPTPTSGDVDALRRVAINLINNATRYARTAVQVSVGPVTSDGQAYAQLLVEDDGPGIPPHERERVFDRFYRVQESRSRETGGTGLGLPIVRDIVRNHGGRVWLEGRSDGRAGLRAIVVLPQQPGPPAAAPVS
ncbi:MAG: HAMP domain-containing histidine kinase, partial [Actinobacteria bacterium]|nr:HAMP domain-containing histidine kinase [Actinomycetota bacterium]